MARDNDKTVLGACVFDNIVAHQQGWVSLNGEPAYRIQSTSEVPDNQILWTNIDSLQRFNSGLSGRFLANDWFKRRFPLIRQEMGWDENDMPCSELAVRMAKLFCRVNGYLRKYVGVKVPNTYGLVDSIRQMRAEDVKGDTPEEVFLHAKNATHAYRSAERITDPTMEYQTLYMPGAKHTQDIATLDRVPKPGGKWQGIRIKDIPDSITYDNELGIAGRWAREVSPVLVRCTVDAVNPLVHSLVNPAGDCGINGRRAWRTSNEIEMLSVFSRIQIHGAWQSTNPVHVRNIVPEMEITDVADGEDPIHALRALSISWQIFADAIWRSGCMIRAHFKYKDHPFTPPYTAFIRTADVLLCQAKAFELLNDKNIIVMGYGSGKINILIEKSGGDDAKKERLREISVRTGLRTNFGACRGITWREEDIRSADDAFNALFALGQREEIEEYDQRAYEYMVGDE